VNYKGKWREQLGNAGHLCPAPVKSERHGKGVGFLTGSWKGLFTDSTDSSLGQNKVWYSCLQFASVSFVLKLWVRFLLTYAFRYVTHSKNVYLKSDGT
jgi:hypothetical protein